MDVEDKSTSCWIHECGGSLPKNATNYCTASQTFRPRYIGIDPLDNLEKDVFFAGRGRKKAWMKAQLVRIDPLAIIEWGPKNQIVTDACHLRSKVLNVIHFNPRVQWELQKVHKSADSSALETHAVGRVRALIPNSKRSPAAVFIPGSKEKVGKKKPRSEKEKQSSKKSKQQKK